MTLIINCVAKVMMLSIQSKYLYEYFKSFHFGKLYTMSQNNKYLIAN